MTAGKQSFVALAYNEGYQGSKKGVFSRTEIRLDVLSVAQKSSETSPVSG